MKIQRNLLVIFVLAGGLFSSCDKINEAKEKASEAKDAFDNLQNLTEKTKDFVENFEENMEKSNDRAAERKKRGETVAMHYEKLGAMFPESIGDFAMEGELNGSTNKMAGMSQSVAKQIYINDNGDELTMEIKDFNGSATTYVTGVMAAYMMEGYEIDDSNQHVKTFKLSEEIKGMKTYGKKNKKAQVDLMVTDRFHINLSMENQKNWDKALEIIQEEIALDKLVKL